MIPEKNEEERLILKDLLDISDLKDLLGYSDLRSLRNWCRKNSIPLVVLGRRTYTKRHLLHDLVDTKLSSIVTENGSLQLKSEATRSVKKQGLNKPIKQVDISSKDKRTRQPKNDCSPASTRLLKNIHSA
jgi:hypothetical protein